MENMVSKFQYLTEVYQNKRVFITGHTGFKGSWLLQMLSLMGATIKGYSLDPKNVPNLYGLIKGQNLCESVIADIRNQDRLKKEIVDFQPDYIFHLAAQPLVRMSYQHPLETFETNIIGTANLLEGVRQLDKPCQVIIITTDKVYYNNEWVFPYRENDRLGGYDPYSASKAGAEIIVDSYRKSFFHPEQYERHLKCIAVARAGNVIGGGDWSMDRIIPDIVRALSHNEPVLIRNPKAVRPWQHVMEPLYGYLLLGGKLIEDPVNFSDAFNFGPYLDDTLTVKELVESSITIWGKGEYQIENSSGQLHEAGLLKLDISKAAAILGWKPKMNALKAISLSVDWYKDFLLTGDAITRTKKQIEEFYGEFA